MGKVWYNMKHIEEGEIRMKPLGSKTIYTARLMLRSITQSDADALVGSPFVRTAMIIRPVLVFN